MNVITFGITMKHTALAMPYRFYAPPMAMQRTTAECIWAAFCRACATGPWLRVAKTEFAFLMWYIFCADEAASNWRFFCGMPNAPGKGRARRLFSFCFPPVPFAHSASNDSAIIEKRRPAQSTLPGCQCTAQLDILGWVYPSRFQKDCCRHRYRA